MGAASNACRPRPLAMQRDTLEFLFETSLEARVEDAVCQAVKLYNLQQRIRQLHTQCERLLTAAGGASSRVATVNDAQRSVLVPALDEVAQAVNQEQTARRVPQSLEKLGAALQRLCTAVSTCFPGGLPAGCEALQGILDACQQPASTTAEEELGPGCAALYFAGKQLQQGKALRDHLRGSNERSKVVVRLQRAGTGPGPREPQLDAEGERAMLAWWHHKQELQRKAGAAGEQEVASYGAEWANPRALKQAFQGTGHVRLKI